MLGSMLIRVDRQTKPGVVSFAVVKDLVLHTMQGFPVEYQFEQKKKILWIAWEDKYKLF